MRDTLALGLPLVAIGRGLVLDPDWVALARDGRDNAIVTALDLSRTPEQLHIPGGLMDTLHARPTGWIPPHAQPEARATADA